MTDVALWIILVALIALVLTGCILTRPTKKDDPPKASK